MVSNRATKTPFDPAQKIIDKVRLEMEPRGVYTRAMRNVLGFAPPLVITEAQVDQLVEAMRGALQAVVPEKA
jgi:L-2,4-diaminobutyrate transaminase